MASLSSAAVSLPGGIMMRQQPGVLRRVLPAQQPRAASALVRSMVNGAGAGAGQHSLHHQQKQQLRGLRSSARCQATADVDAAPAAKKQKSEQGQQQQQKKKGGGGGQQQQGKGGGGSLAIGSLYLAAAAWPSIRVCMRQHAAASACNLGSQ
jgi:hypothetical protein